MCNKVDPQCFCCTTLRDVIFTDKSFRECYVMTCALQYAVVCWVTVAAEDGSGRGHGGAAMFYLWRKGTTHMKGQDKDEVARLK